MEIDIKTSTFNSKYAIVWYISCLPLRVSAVLKAYFTENWTSVNQNFQHLFGDFVL